MKSAWIKYFPIIIGIMLFIACKNHTKPAVAADDTNPVFQNDPNLKLITDRIVKSPGDAELYFQRAGMLRKLRMDSLALKDYKAAATLDTTKAEYLSAVGDFLFENKDITGSVEWIQKAIAKNPKDRKAHLKIAKLFLYTQDYAKALGEIDVVMRQDVYNPEAYFLKGMVYKEMKDTAKAISSFLTSVQVAPDYREAIIQLGLLYSAKKDPIALKYLDNAYHLDSTDVFPVFAKGVYYQNQEDFVQAKQEYTKCIYRNRRYADAYFNMGIILMQQDSVQKAYRQYDIVTKIDPTNPTAYYDRGVCSELMDSVKNAIADYKQSVSLDTAYKKPKEALKRLGVKS